MRTERSEEAPFPGITVPLEYITDFGGEPAGRVLPKLLSGPSVLPFCLSGVLSLAEELLVERRR